MTYVQIKCRFFLLGEGGRSSLTTRTFYEVDIGLIVTPLGVRLFVLETLRSISGLRKRRGYRNHTGSEGEVRRDRYGEYGHGTRLGEGREGRRTSRSGRDGTTHPPQEPEGVREHIGHDTTRQQYRRLGI